VSRGQQVIRDPAIAVAAGKCWLSRWNTQKLMGVNLGTFHPAPCLFCEYTPEFLIEAIDEFLDWSNLREDDPTKEPVPLRGEVSMFLDMSAEEQAREVLEAQGYTTA
jgi:hypothetical protein